MDSDNIAVLDSEVMSNYTVHAGAPIIQFVISENDEHCVLALLALDQYSIAAEELQSLHSVVRERNDRVIIVSGICDPMPTTISPVLAASYICEVLTLTS